MSSIPRYYLPASSHLEALVYKGSDRGAGGNVRIHGGEFFRNHILVNHPFLSSKLDLNRGSLIDYLNAQNEEEGKVERYSKGFFGWIGGTDDKKLQDRYQEVLAKNKIKKEKDQVEDCHKLISGLFSVQPNVSVADSISPEDKELFLILIGKRRGVHVFIKKKEQKVVGNTKPTVEFVFYVFDIEVLSENLNSIFYEDLRKKMGGGDATIFEHVTAPINWRGADLRLTIFIPQKDVSSQRKVREVISSWQIASRNTDKS